MVADALSRRADYIPESECVVNAVITAAVETDFLHGVVENYSHDPLCSQASTACQYCVPAVHACLHSMAPRTLCTERSCGP